MPQNLKMRIRFVTHDSKIVSDKTILEGYCFGREEDHLSEKSQEFYFAEVTFSCLLPKSVRIEKLILREIVDPLEVCHEYVISEFRDRPLDLNSCEQNQ